MKERRSVKKSLDILMAKIKQDEQEVDDEEDAINRKIPKWQGVDATGGRQKLARVKEVQKYLKESELTLSAKGLESELAYDRKRKLAGKKLRTKMIDVEKKEAAVDHKIEKLVEKEKEWEKRLAKCRKKEENGRRKDKGLKEKANILREAEKSLENEKQMTVAERENLLNLKTEGNQMDADVEEQQLNRTEEERLKLLQLGELSVLCRDGCELQCKLKNEIQEYTAQKELLLKENEEVRRIRKNLEEKESEIDKDLIIITEQKQRLEEIKHSEEDQLRQKRLATLEHIEKELNALERSKKSFASTMDSERAVICEKIQNARREMLQEFSELKEQLENELQTKLKSEFEQYRLKKELHRKETEQLKQERVILDEKLSKIERGLMDINDQKQRFEKLKQSEEEYLKQEKLATQEYIQKELDALERSKKSFASRMDQEKTVISERIQNERCQMLHEFSELKEQLENELQSKLKYESEQFLLQKELLAKESERLKQERVSLDDKLSELEKLKHSEEENLKQQKLATQEYIQRELDALNISKEKFENHRIHMLHEYELRKRQCENEVQSKLKHETEDCRLQKELLLKENEDLRQRKKAFDVYLRELDKKQSQVQEQLIELRDQRDKFEQQKTSEVERFKQEKWEAEECKRRELDAVKLSKERIQNERSEMLLELKLWKTQLENEMKCKRKEMEKQFSLREKLVEEREKEVNTIKMLPVAPGSGSAVCSYRNGTSEISSLPPVMVNECSLRIVEIEDIHDQSRDADNDVPKKQDVPKNLHSSHLGIGGSTVVSAALQDSYEIMGITLGENQQNCPNGDADHLICMPSQGHAESSVVDEVLVANCSGDSSSRSLLTDAKRSSNKRRYITLDSSIPNQNRDLTSLTLTDSNSGSMTGVDCGNDHKDINLQINYTKQSENAACGGNQEVSATRKSKRQRRISQVLEDYHLEYFA